MSEAIKHITLFGDGSSLGNPGPGGWGTILRYGSREREMSGGEAMTTNNRMELTAVIRGLEALTEPCSVEIVSDSQYVTRGIGEWLAGWRRKSFKNVKNVDLWERYIAAAAPHRVRTTWVRGHDGHPENERCDELARTEAAKYQMQGAG